MLKIGWESTDITPLRPVILQGQMHVRISKEALDPLTATACAIESESGDDQAIIISCDLAMIHETLLGLVRDKVKEKCPEVDAEKIIMTATHTHTGPVISEGNYEEPEDESVMRIAETREFIADKIAAVTVGAWTSREDSLLSDFYNYAVVGHNRRATYLDGTSRMYGKVKQDEFKGFEGYVDHSLDMVFSFDSEKKLKGILLSVPCPSQVTESLYEISADYWHETRIELKKEFGEDVKILSLCGIGGDISPHIMLNKELELKGLEKQGLSERQQIANRIRNAVAESYETAKNNIEEKNSLIHIAKDISLSNRKVSKEDLDYAEKMFEQTHKPGGTWRENQLERVRTLYKDPDSIADFKMELHVLKIGDIAIAFNCFELFTEFGLRIKARSNAPHTILCQLASNKYGRGIYLPTKEATQGGHYSGCALDNPVGPEGGFELVEQTLTEIEKLFPEEKE
ncbi:MAG: hypothetical protein ACYTFY_14910 [Planctomycetota bacterium]|jgi:hypothetical protein